MSEAVIPRIALAGIPNCGKTALFNALTGGRQKVGNYPGVTVERKEGFIHLPNSGGMLSILDLPGTYSLDARTPDEVITRDVLLGTHAQELPPQTLVAVADATNLERNLGLVLELRELGRPCVLALNMMDLADARGLELDLNVLERELRLPVIPTVAVKGKGILDLVDRVARMALEQRSSSTPAMPWKSPTPDEVRARFAEVDRILKAATRKQSRPSEWTDRIDRVVLHPLWGSLFLIGILLVLFQAIFTWAKVPMDAIQAIVDWSGAHVGAWLGEGPLQSLITDGVLAGAGAVLVFLPQILLLFFFILILEDSGYMARAAFLMDRLMGKVGLHGRAFIPLLSSYACAIPGIMATRTIGSPRDRLTTILVAPLTTCSARLPVYALLVAAFIPDRVIWGPFRLQGLVMFGLYFIGIASALLVAVCLRKFVLSGPKPPLLIELPTYKLPGLRSLGQGLVERARLFLRRAGTVILTLSVILWFLASYPKAPLGAPEPAIQYSYAGKIGRVLEPVFRPIGFNWRISVALIPGFAAREVMIGALGTTYAVQTKDSRSALSEKIAKDWSLATALSLLAWYIFAPQCLSTLAVTRRETNSLKWPLFMVFYMSVLAYSASFVVYQTSRWLGWG